MALRGALTPFGEATLKTIRAYHRAFAGRRQPNGVQQDINALIAAISAGTPTARATSAQAKASIMTISLLLPGSPALRLGAQHA